MRTARESLRSPRLVATTLSNVPDLKSDSAVCVQLLVPTPYDIRADGAAIAAQTDKTKSFFITLLHSGSSFRRSRGRRGLADVDLGVGIDADHELGGALHHVVGRHDPRR